MANGNGRMKIKTFWGRDKLLEVSVRPGIDKVALFAGVVTSGKVTTSLTHYLDLATAGRIARQISIGAARKGWSYKEYKGGSNGDGQVVSRVLEMSVSETKKGGLALFITLSQGPGKRTQTGAVVPDGKPTESITFAIGLDEAQSAFYILDVVVSDLIKQGHGLPKDSGHNGGHENDIEDVEDAPAPEEEEDLIF